MLPRGSGWPTQIRARLADPLEMTSNDLTRAEKVQFPPIPLASGAAFIGEDGSEHTAQTASFVMHAEDGSSIEVPLDLRFGGWWAPVV